MEPAASAFLTQNSTTQVPDGPCVTSVGQQNARLLQNVAKQMQRVFKLIAAEKRGDLKDSDRLVLTRTGFVSGWLDVVSVAVCYCSSLLYVTVLVTVSW